MRENSSVRMLQVSRNDTFLALPSEGGGARGLISSVIQRMQEEGIETVRFERLDKRFDPYIEGPFSITVPEDTLFVRDLAPNFNGTDCELIIEGPDAELFELDKSRALCFKNPPDFENPSSSQGSNTYRVSIRMIDKYRQSVQAFVVSISDEDDFIVPYIVDTSFQYAENSGISWNLTAVSNSLNPTFSITGGDDAAKFTVTPAGEISFVVPPDHENPTTVDGTNFYKVEVTVDDGVYQVANNITVEVMNVSENSDYCVQFYMTNLGGATTFRGYSEDLIVADRGPVWPGAGGICSPNVTRSAVLRQCFLKKDDANNRIELYVTFSGYWPSHVVAARSTFVFPGLGSFNFSNAISKNYSPSTANTQWKFHITGTSLWSALGIGTVQRPYLL